MPSNPTKTKANREWLYSTMTKNGYNIGKDQADFDSLLAKSPKNREWLYDKATKRGLNVGKDLGDFEHLMGWDNNQPQTEQTAQAGQQTAQSQVAQAQEQSAPETASNPYHVDVQDFKPKVQFGQQQTQPQRTDFTPAVSSSDTFNTDTTDAIEEGSERARSRTSYEMQRPDIDSMSEEEKQKETEKAAAGKMLDIIEDKQNPINDEVRQFFPDYHYITERSDRFDAFLADYRAKNYRLGEIEQKMAEVDKRIEEARKPWKQYFSTGRYDEQSGRIVYDGSTEGLLEAGNEVQELRAAKRALTRSRNLAEEAKRYDQGDTYFLGNVGRGMKDKFWDNGTWDWGASDVKDAKLAMELKDKIDRGEELTDTDRVLLNAMAEEAQVQMATEGKQTRGYKAGETTMFMLPFMVEMAVNPISGVTKAAGKTAARKATDWLASTAFFQARKRFGQGMLHYLTKGGIHLGTALAGGTLMAGTTGIQRVEADYLKRRLGQVIPTVNQNGEVEFQGFDDSQVDSKAWAAYKALMQQGIENATEIMGAALPVGKALGALGRGATATAGRLGLRNTSRILAGLGENIAPLYNYMKNWPLANILEKGNWNGNIEEWMEEQIGMVLNQIMGVENTFTTDEGGMFNLDNQIDTLLGVGLFGTFVSTAATGSYAYNRHKARTKMAEAERLGTNLFGEEWVGNKKLIEDASPEELARILAIAKVGMTKAESDVLIRYATALQMERAVGLAELAKPQREPGQPQPLEEKTDESFSQGAEASTPEEIHAVAQGQQSAEQMLAEADPNILSMLQQRLDAGASNTELQAVMEGLDSRTRTLAESYIASRAATEGVVAGAEQRAEEEGQRYSLAVGTNATEEEDGTSVITTGYYKDSPYYVRSTGGGMTILADAEGNTIEVPEEEVQNVTSSTLEELADRHTAEAMESERTKAEFYLKHNAKTQMDVQPGMVLQNGGTQFIVANVDGNEVSIVPAVYDAEQGRPVPQNNASANNISLEEAYVLQDQYYDSIDNNNTLQTEADVQQPDVADTGAAGDTGMADTGTRTDGSVDGGQNKAEPAEAPAYPTDKNGKTDYSQIDNPEMMASAAQAEFGGDAVAFIDAEIAEAQAVIDNPKTANVERFRARKRISMLSDAKAAIAPEAAQTAAEEPRYSITDEAQQQTQPTEEQETAQSRYERMTEEGKKKWEAMQKDIDTLAKALGVTIDYEEGLRQREGCNGKITGTHITLDPAFPEKSLEFLLGHELTHRMQDLTPEQYHEFKISVINVCPDFRERVDRITDLYLKSGFQVGNTRPANWNGRTISREQMDDEAIADYVGEMYQIENALDEFISAMRQPAIIRKLIEFFNWVTNNLSGLNTLPFEYAQTQLNRAFFNAAAVNAEQANAKAEEQAKKEENKNDVQKALEDAEKETDTEPTEAQKEAGNYKKGHFSIDGYDVTIENPKGSIRRGTDASGKQWEQEMHNTYGYIRGTEGVDGDHIDVFFSEDPSQGEVFVIDQVNKDGSFDEHKVMYGFPDIESARQAYLSNYEEGWQGLGAITPVSKEEFKKWIDSSHRKTKPFAQYSSVELLGETQAASAKPSKAKDKKRRKKKNGKRYSIATTEEIRQMVDGEGLTEDEANELADKGLIMDGGAVMDMDSYDLKQETGYKTPNELTDLEEEETRYSLGTSKKWMEQFLGDNPTKRQKVIAKAVMSWYDRAAADDAVNDIISKREYPGGDLNKDGKGPLRKNVEYVYTFDLDTTCPRTLQYLGYAQRIEKIISRPLSQKEAVILIETMRAYGQQIPCVYCYAENKRQALKQYFLDFIEYRNNVLNAATEEEARSNMYGQDSKGKLSSAAEKVLAKWRDSNVEMNSYRPTMKKLYSDYMEARDSLLVYLDYLKGKGEISEEMSDSEIVKRLLARYNIEPGKDASEDDKNIASSMGTIVNDWRYDELEGTKHKMLDEKHIHVWIASNGKKALALWNEMTKYAKSASGAHNSVKYYPYTNELLDIPAQDRDYINGMSGLRMHSSNDFRIDYLGDYLQLIADMDKGGWLGHTYTKNPMFVRIFGNTGYRINMSIAGYDVNGKVEENRDEGQSWDDVKELRKLFPNAGTMFMTTSSLQLDFALNADWVDMIIPFHNSGLPKAIWYDMRRWEDAQSKQNEKLYTSADMKAALKEAGVKIPKGATTSDIESLYDEHFKPKKIFDNTADMKAELKEAGVKIPPKSSYWDIKKLYVDTFGHECEAQGTRKTPHFLPYVTWVGGTPVPGHNNDAKRYLELCKEYGCKPRFQGTKVHDAEGNEMDITEHPGYIKVIKESARTDTPQMPVKFNLDEPSEALGVNQSTGKLWTPLEYAFNQLQEFAWAGGYTGYEKDDMGVINDFLENVIKWDEEHPDEPRQLDFISKEAREYWNTTLNITKSAAERAAMSEQEAQTAPTPYHPNPETGEMLETPRNEENGKKKTRHSLTPNQRRAIQMVNPMAEVESENRYSISEKTDREYLDAVESSDMDKAQQMVREAAKKAMPNTKVVDEDGYPLAVYHGTPHGGFSIFKSQRKNGEFYFSDNRYVANSYENNVSGENPTLYEVYLNITKPLRYDAKNKSFNELSTDNRISELISKAKEKGHDGVVIQNIFDSPSGWSKDIDNLGTVYIALSPTQIKSSDTVTYDDSGNVIPLSERFNESNEDIRYSLGGRKPVGGNSGYVGYSMSKRAASARNDGRYPKTDFKKEYGLTDKALDTLVDAGLISDKEWHHTSMYGNKTTFYAWEEPWMADVYADNKNQIDKISRDKPEGYDDILYDLFWESENAKQAEKEREEERARQDEENRLRSEYNKLYGGRIETRYELSNGVQVVTNGNRDHNGWTMYKNGEVLNKNTDPDRSIRSAATAELDKIIERPSFEEWKEAVNDIRYSLGGLVGADGTPELMDNLNLARDLEDSGKDAKTIWRITGWERGKDGQWRFEIPDGKMKDFTRDTLHTVGDMIDAPELFDFYPRIKDYKIKLAFMGNTLGEADTENETIKLNSRTAIGWNSKGEATWIDYPTLIHEIQHIIQDMEGFAKGGNKETGRASRFRELPSEEEKLAAFGLAFSNNSNKQLISAGKGYLASLLKEFINKKGNVKGIDMYKQALDALESVSDEDFPSFVKKAKKTYKSVSDEEAFDRYKRLAGETEARNASTRLGLLERERREVPPSATEDVPRDEQIVRYSLGSGLTKEQIEERIGESLDSKNYNQIRKINPFMGMLYSDKVPETLPYREVFKTPTLDDYYISTRTTFASVGKRPESNGRESLKSAEEENRRQWSEMKESGKYEWHKSPLSSSEYLIDRKSGDIYRFADHWDIVSSCWWKIDEPQGGDKGIMQIGKSNIKDFKGITPQRTQRVENPAYNQRYEDSLKKTISNYETLLESDVKIQPDVRKRIEGVLENYKELLDRFQKENYKADRTDQVRYSLSSQLDEQYPGWNEGSTKKNGRDNGLRPKLTRNQRMALAMVTGEELSEEDKRYSLASKEDREYLDAVEAGDTRKVKKMVYKAAEDNGYTVLANHGTRNDFTVFSHDYQASNQFARIGYWFSTEEGFGKKWAEYGTRKGEVRQMDVILSLQNPKVYTVDSGKLEELQKKRDEISKQIEELEKKIAGKGKLAEARVSYVDLRVNEGETEESIREAVEGEPMFKGLLLAIPELEGYVKESKKLAEELKETKTAIRTASDSYDVFRKDVLDTFGITSADDINMTLQDFFFMIDIKKAKEFTDRLKRQGYDGIIIRDTKYDAMAVEKEKIDQYVVFDPEQIKSADPVTYDNNGNVIPLSERFNRKQKDIRYSIAKDGTLVGVHNISEAKLNKAINMGGLVNPSLAVVDTDNGQHTEYGEISLIAPSELIDKKTGRNIGTFDRDAYTPMYPPVVYFPNKQSDANEEKLFKGLDKELAIRLHSGIHDYLEGNVTHSGLEYLFLKERHPELKPDDVQVARRTFTTMKEISDRFFDGKEPTYKAYEQFPEDKKTEFNLFIAGGGRITDSLRGILTSNNPLDKSLAKRMREEASYGQFDGFIGMVEADERNVGKIDVKATIDAAIAKLRYDSALQSEFEDWQMMTIDNLGFDEKIQVGWKADGSRIYKKNTLENVSAYMKKQGRNASSQHWASGAGYLMAKVANNMKSLDSIRKNKGRLSKDADRIGGEVRKRIHDVLQLFMESGNRDLFSNEMNAFGYLEDIVVGGMSPEKVAEDFNKHTGMNLSLTDEQKKELIKLRDDIKDIPVRYFETKFERPVMLDEFAAAVVPSTITPRVEQGLKDAGLPIYKYDPETSGSREEVMQRAIDQEPNTRFSLAAATAPTFYSNAGHAVERINQNKATPEQWEAMLRKNGGLKAEEDKWLGLTDWLHEQNGTVTKQQILDYINTNDIEIKDVNYDDEALFTPNSKANLESEIARRGDESIEDVLESWDNEFGTMLLSEYEEGTFTVDEDGKIVTDLPVVPPIDETRSGLTTRGLRHNREIALVVPSIEPYTTGNLPKIHFADEYTGGRAVAWIRFGETKDEAGNKVLVIDEVQSQRHQDARERGYKSEDNPRAAYDKALKEMNEYRRKMQDKYGLYFLTDDMTEDEQKEYRRLFNILDNASNEKGNGLFYDVPDAPFRNNWQELAMKRMLRYAAENGYDKLAWTYGRQQAERYGLSKVVDSLVANRKGDKFHVSAFDKRDMPISSATKDYTKEEMVKTFGKDITERIIRGIEEEEAEDPRLNAPTYHMEGVDLDVGGKGMEGFYDRMLPQFIDKYCKRLGTKTQDITLPWVEASGRIMHSIDITPEMKDYVLTQGQPRYSIASGDLPQQTIEAWDRLAKSQRFQLRETMFDYLTAVDKFQEFIAKENNGRVMDYQNAYMAMLALSSRNKAQMDVVDNMLVAPLNQIIKKITGAKARMFGKWDWESGELRRLDMYLKAKHGLERNRDMAVREALREKLERDIAVATSKYTDAKELKAEIEKINKAYRDRLNDWYDYLEQERSNGKEWLIMQHEMDEYAVQEFGADLSEDYAGLSGKDKETPGLFPDADDWMEAAYDYVFGYEAGHQQADIDELWHRIGAIAQFSLNKQNQSGLTSAEYVTEQTRRYQFYVPLRGWNADIAQDEYDYIDSRVGDFGNPIKKAKGRKSEAGNVMGALLNIAYRSISTGNKNLAMQKFFNLVSQFNTNGLAVINSRWMELVDGQWTEVEPTIPDDATPEETAEILARFEREMEDKRKNGEAKRIRGKEKMAYKTIGRQKNEHQVRVYIGGEEKVITVTGDPRITQALNGLTNPSVADSDDYIEQKNSAIRNFMAGAFTSKNMAFSIRNLARDTIHANNYAFCMENFEYWMRFTRNQNFMVGNVANMVKMMRLISGYNKAKTPETEDERLFKEFMEGGGATGYTYIQQQDELAEELADMLQKHDKSWVNPVDYVKRFFELTEFFGNAAELSNRFAAFKTSRQMGRSVSRSVSDAKEITLNFNRKGAGAQTKGNTPLVRKVASMTNFGRRFILFFNANMQGKYQLLRMLEKHPVKTVASRLVAPAVFMGMALPIINNVILPAVYQLLGMGSGDDGDEDNYFDSLTDHERSSYLCFRLPNKAGWLKIPLPPDITPMTEMGDLIGAAANGSRDMSAYDVTKCTVDMMSPVNINWGSGNTINWTAAGLSFMPTAVQPIGQAMTNTNYLGRNIYRKSFTSYDTDPEYRKTFRSTSPLLKELSRVANNLGGGTDYTTSDNIMDVNPALVQHFITSYLGGYGTTAVDITNALYSAYTGEDTSMTIQKVPVVSSFVVFGNKDVTKSRIESAYAEVNAIANKMKDKESNMKAGYKEAEDMGDVERAAKTMTEFNRMREGYDYKFYSLNKEVFKFVKKLDKSPETSVLQENLKYQLMKELTQMYHYRKPGRINAVQSERGYTVTIDTEDNKGNTISTPVAEVE